MLNLNDNNTSYIIVSASKSDTDKEVNDKRNSNLEDELYLLEFDITNIDGYINGVYEKSFIATKQISNDDLRITAIQLMDRYEQDNIIIKYLNESNAKKIYQDGGEKSLGTISFSDDLSNKSYICGTMSFSFLEMNRYHYLKDESEFKPGMIVEMLMNNDKWVERIVQENEYDKIYKLMSKYNKVRIII